MYARMSEEDICDNVFTHFGNSSNIGSSDNKQWFKFTVWIMYKNLLRVSFCFKVIKSGSHKKILKNIL